VVAIAIQFVACGGRKPATDVSPVRSPLVFVEIIVKVEPSALAVDGEPRRRLEACARGLGVTLTPLHPATADADLASYLGTRVDAGAAEQIAARLRECPGVEGAYPKPPGAPPGRM